MEISIRAYTPNDLTVMTEIWNQVVEEANAFPQEEGLTAETAAAFFAGQSFAGVAQNDETGDILGLYILHPNNVGRCGHLANASYAVRAGCRGMKVGEKLVRHSLQKGRELGYRILQFNAVVASNKGAIHLYEKLGFVQLGTVPGGYRLSPDDYEDIILFYHPL